MSTVYDEKLLDKVGLAMVPSGYTNNVADEGNTGGALGKVYSVLPAQTIGDNIITNGDFSDGDTGWTVGSWVVQNGEATIDGTQSSVAPLTRYNVPIYGGDTLKLTFDVTRSAGTISYMYLAGTFISGGINESGTYTYTVDYTNSQTLQIVADANFIGSVDNIKVQRITDGDFDFSRGSDATRVNSQGYIESVQVLSDELVQNGDFEEVGSELSYNPTCDDSIAYGNAGSGYSDEDGTDQVYFYNGGIKAERLRAGNVRLRLAKSSGAASGIVQSNKIYKVTFNVIEADFNGDGSANIQFYFDGNTPFATISETPASYEFYVKSGSAGNGIAQWSMVWSELNYYAVFDNVSVKEVGQNWTFGTGWSITDDGGNLKAVADNAAFGVSLTQNISFVDNKKYRVTYTISDYVSGSITMNLGSAVTGATRNANGTYTEDYIHSGVNTLYVRPSTNNTSLTIDNILVVEITDDTDIPRLDYTNAACPSLLLEPERTNVITQSVLPTGWTSSVTGVTSTKAPDNSNNATSWAQSSSPTGYYKGATLQSTGDIIMSVFVKDINNSGDIGKIRVGSDNPYFGTGSETAYIEFDVSTETATSTTSGVLDYGYEKYKDNWYRVWVKANVPSQLTMNFIAYASKPTGSNAIIAVWGYQVENGSYPTSYIPTSGLLVTRRADICNNAGDSTIFNDSEGVLFLETYALNNSNDSGTISIRGNQTPSVNLVTVKLNYSSNSIQFFIYNNGNLDVNRTINYDLSKPIKLAIKYSVEESSIWINGKQEFGGIIGFTGFSANNLKDISFDTFSGEYLEANVRSLLYFNEALSNAELEYITSADIDLTIHNYKGSLSKISATYEDVGVKDRLTKLF